MFVDEATSVALVGASIATDRGSILGSNRFYTHAADCVALVLSLSDAMCALERNVGY
jgi:hypothetical protein